MFFTCHAFVFVQKEKKRNVGPPLSFVALPMTTLGEKKLI